MSYLYAHVNSFLCVSTEDFDSQETSTLILETVSLIVGLSQIHQQYK